MDAVIDIKDAFVDALPYILMFIVLWLAAAVYTILAINVVKAVYRKRGQKYEYRSDDWSRDHPAPGYEIDHRQPNFD